MIEKSMISNIDLAVGANDLSKNSLNLSKLMNSDGDDLGSDIDDPQTQAMQRFSNHSPVKMSIDLSKILAKREQE